MIAFFCDDFTLITQVPKPSPDDELDAPNAGNRWHRPHGDQRSWGDFRDATVMSAILFRGSRPRRWCARHDLRSTATLQPMLARSVSGHLPRKRCAVPTQTSRTHPRSPACWFEAFRIPDKRCRGREVIATP